LDFSFGSLGTAIVAVLALLIAAAAIGAAVKSFGEPGGIE